MKTLKDFENLIRDTVREMNAKDPNWRWSVHSLEDNKAFIRWGYLDYMESPNPFFSLELSHFDGIDQPDEYFLAAKDHINEFIDGAFMTHVDEKKSYQESWENGIKHVLHQIDYYAHSRY